MLMHAVSTDVIDSCGVAGVTLTWLRKRGVEGGHWVTMQARDDVEASNHGPFDRSTADLAYESMRAALLAAGRQQTAQLRRIRPSAKRWSRS